jgi:hypothetical protein
MPRRLERRSVAENGKISALRSRARITTQPGWGSRFATSNRFARERADERVQVPHPLRWHWGLWATAVCANPIDRLQVVSALSSSDSVSPKPGVYTEAKCPIGYEAYSFGGAIVPSNGQVQMLASWVGTDHTLFFAQETGAATAATGFKSPKPSACRRPTTSPTPGQVSAGACPVSGHWCLAGSFLVGPQRHKPRAIQEEDHSP